MMVRTSDQVFGGPLLAFLAPARIGTRDGRGDGVGRPRRHLRAITIKRRQGGLFLREEREYGRCAVAFTSMDGLCSRLIRAC
jgi:hypothetical protein